MPNTITGPAFEQQFEDLAKANKIKVIKPSHKDKQKNNLKMYSEPKVLIAQADHNFNKEANTSGLKKIDFYYPAKKTFIELKCQQTPGTSEQKIAYSVDQFLKQKNIKTIIVYYGEGFSKKFIKTLIEDTINKLDNNSLDRDHIKILSYLEFQKLNFFA